MPVTQGHLASVQTGLNFVNTLDLWPTPHDHLDTPEAALDWLVDNDLLHKEARAELLHRYEDSPGAGRAMLIVEAPPRAILAAYHACCHIRLHGLHPWQRHLRDHGASRELHHPERDEKWNCYGVR